MFMHQICRSSCLYVLCRCQSRCTASSDFHISPRRRNDERGSRTVEENAWELLLLVLESLLLVLLGVRAGRQSASAEPLLSIFDLRPSSFPSNPTLHPQEFLGYVELRNPARALPTSPRPGLTLMRPPLEIKGLALWLPAPGQATKLVVVPWPTGSRGNRLEAETLKGSTNSRSRESPGEKRPRRRCCEFRWGSP